MIREATKKDLTYILDIYNDAFFILLLYMPINL